MKSAQKKRFLLNVPVFQKSKRILTQSKRFHSWATVYSIGRESNVFPDFQ